VTVRIRRVTTTRSGGVSAPPYDSFNLGDHVGDDPAAVAANRKRLASAIGLPADHVIWMNQVHGVRVEVVDAPRSTAVEATDALVTTTPGLALAVITADCVPVLLSDARAGVVGAVPAGRVGAADGAGLLGPAVSGPNYEVPEQMAAEVEAHLPGSRTTTPGGTPALDLRAGIARQLVAAGITAIDIDPRCTVADTRLFSHRRGAPTGRLASLIWME
jgi:YfiH family protein